MVSGQAEGRDLAVEQAIKDAYREILSHFVEHGRAPHYSELAGALGVSIDEARHLQRDTAEAGPVAGLHTTRVT